MTRSKYLTRVHPFSLVTVKYELNYFPWVMIDTKSSQYFKYRERSQTLNDRCFGKYFFTYSTNNNKKSQENINTSRFLILH